jgi:small subunit ribosomal protein S4
MKLFLKGTRCEMAKCAIDRGRPAPGVHGARKHKITSYAEQLREKQRLRRMYGILENQFRVLFGKAQRRKGVTGDMLLRLLETRLDNVVFRMGFAPSRAQARQMVCHGHFRIGGRTVDIPSYQCRAGQIIEVKKQERIRTAVKKNFELTEKREIPSWLSMERAEFRGAVVRLPEKPDITIPVNVQLVVELYSK